MRKLNIENTIKAIKNKNNLSVAAVLREIKLSDNNGTNYQKIYNIVRDYDLDTSHWLGKASCKGKTTGFKRPISDYLNNIQKVNSYSLKIRLFEEGIKEEKCESCGGIEWIGKKIPLELHHIDGDNKNNNLLNLQILCPNCHAFTDNFCSKNREKPKRIKRTISHEEIILAIKSSHNCLEVLSKIGLSSAAANYDKIINIKERYGIDFLPTQDSVRILGNPDWRAEPKFNQRKVIRPSKDELIELIKTKSMCQIAKDFGLKNDNSIRKWCESYGINYKEISPFSLVYKKLNPKPEKKRRIEKSIYKYVCEEIGRGWVARIRDYKTKKYLFVKHTKTELEAAQAVAKYFNSDDLLLKAPVM